MDAPATRTWGLPPEPGTEITAVRCACCLRTWERIEWPFLADGTRAPRGGSWVWKSTGGARRRWRALLLDHTVEGGPLTDASP